MKETAQQTIARLERQAAEQQAALTTYKQTLTEIYDLYDDRVEELGLVRRLSESLRMSLDQKKVCLAITEVVMDELSPDGSLLLLLGRDGRLRLKASAQTGQEAIYWADRNPVQDLARQAEAGPVGRAAQTAQPVLEPDLTGADGLLAGAASLVALPLIAREETIGVFGLVGQTGGAFGEAAVRILTIICDQAAAALYNVRLFNEVRRVNRVLRRSEREARLARESLERLLENANDWIVTLNSRGQVVYANSRVETLGYRPGELIGRPIDRLVDQTDGRADLEADLGRGQVRELYLVDAQGQPRTALVSFTPLPPAGEADPTALIIARDITERKQLERQLMHSEKLASVGLLAAGVAHEIGNPLSAISGYAQILKKEGLDPEQSRQFAGAIEDQAGRIERIIQDLLTYSRPSTGVRTRIGLNRAVESIVNMLTNQKLFRGLEAITQFDPAEPEVYMDRDLLAQVVVNLVVNAAQALADNPPEAGGRIKITTAHQGGLARLTIEDNGPGVPQDKAPRIFDPFFTTKPVGQGTGLGLSICHRIIEGEGGQIRLLSQAPQGAAFEISLPLAGEDEKEPRSPG